MWPEPTLLRDKLYVNLEELRRTAAFVRATGISVKWTTTMKKKKETNHRLVGLVVMRPPRERKVPGTNRACAGIFFRGRVIPVT